MNPRRPALLLLAVVVAVTAPLFGATRLTYTMGGRSVPVYWANDSFPIPYEIDRRLGNVIPNGIATVDRAFNAWSLTDTNISFRQLGVADVTAGWDHVNTVSMSDTLMKDYGFLALTTNWYDNDGKLTEGDIQLDSSIARGDYNVQLTIQHEVGHLLGLDHSPVLSAVMYPYVSRGVIPPPLDSDDRNGVTTLYPKDANLSGAVLQGKVMGDSGGIFAAQVVAVNADGEPVATGLTDTSGDFSLKGVPTGDYRIYVEPLDGPVDVRNLAGVWRQAKVTSFPTEFLSGPPLHVESGKVYGNLNVNANGIVRLNPKWVGTNEDGSANFSLSSTPITITSGRTVTVAIAGDGMISGMTTFDVLNPGFSRVGDYKYAANFVYATFDVAGNAPPGSSVVLVKSGNETATLTGALRVQSVTKSRSVRH